MAKDQDNYQPYKDDQIQWYNIETIGLRTIVITFKTIRLAIILIIGR